MTRRHLLLAGLLLAGAALTLTAPGPLDTARTRYERIARKMSEGEVRGLLRDWCLGAEMGGLRGHTSLWFDRRSGTSITVDFDSRNRVAGKDFYEGDQSRAAQLRRFKERLADNCTSAGSRRP
jgi:hypothetical protein